MTLTKTTLLATALAGLAMAGTARAETYVRAGSEDIDVVDKGGRLYCTRASDGYEMCNGMTRQGDGSWQGKKMKHPDMPRWMSFNGTVVFSDAGLSIKGCAVGMCDSETWARKK